MLWFKCKHPAQMLAVDRAEKREQLDEDFDSVTYYLRCRKCGEAIEIEYASLRGGVSAFLNRARKQTATNC